MSIPDWGVAFAAGLLTPLGAACVLPLYPGYLSFLAGHAGAVRGLGARLSLGIAAGAGILVSMFAFGLVVVLMLSYPLADALGIISPVAYSVLGIIGVLLILGRGPEFTFSSPHLPGDRMPFFGAFLFGLFFGILILPCNAAPIAVLLALSTSTSDFIANMLNFIFFGAGMAVPLIALSAVSLFRGKEATALLVRHKRIINLVTGTLMVIVALYYLFAVIRIQDFGG
jgi:cytochrome c-type biogenesis protein